MANIEEENKKLKDQVFNLDQDLKFYKSELKRTDQWYMQHIRRLKKESADKGRNLTLMKLKFKRLKEDFDAHMAQTASGTSKSSAETGCKSIATALPKKLKESPKIKATCSSTDKSEDSDKCLTNKDLLKKLNLPDYPVKVRFRDKDTRSLLPKRPCEECSKWFKDSPGGVTNCKHRELWPKPEEDPSIWTISFPDPEDP